MAIHFSTIRWKNFLSTGNSFTEIQLDQKPTTLVVGENGAGKSTMLDAICFALFNRPYRNVNKPTIVNSINNKNCSVELEFTIGLKSYKVIRGMKPAVFEIHVDGVLLNQDAAARDYQKYLEDSILKLNYKSFTQIVILGSASFTPFMQLPAATRREVIEDILDIRIFTSMNLVLKERINELKSKIHDLDMKISIAKNKTEVQQNYIKNLQEDRADRVHTLEKQIEESSATAKELEKRSSIVTAGQNSLTDSISDLRDISTGLGDLIKLVSSLETSGGKITKDIKFYHDNDTCPKCKQGIAHEFKQETIQEHQEELDTINKELAQIKVQESVLQKRLDEIDVARKKIETLGDEIQSLRREKEYHERLVQRLILEKADLQQKVGNIEVEKQKLRDMAIDALINLKDRSDIGMTNHYYDIAGILLKDTGIKTRIIRQYLPVINKLVNKYLISMDFFVQFTLNEKFEETIKSRYRDEFSYENFSEGEKQRIDLAMIFTWRTIAKLKNSASTNLLILDEVFDSSLDNAATEHVMTLLNTLGEGTNTFVITHRGDQLFDRFSTVIKFVKKHNFSVVA